jgi:hypothetical protein
MSSIKRSHYHAADTTSTYVTATLLSAAFAIVWAIVAAPLWH